MRILQKQISLESVTSRLPGLYPAYKDGELFFFDEEHLKARGYEYPNNWGMVPVLLSLNQKPNPSSTCNNYIITCDSTFKMSWETMSKWYYFFTEYYHLLNDYGHCGVIYSSAVDYYENESRDKHSYQMVYGTERSTYEEMDRLLNERGGIIQLTAICTESDTSSKFKKGTIYKYSYDEKYVVINDENREKIVDETYFKSHFCQDKTIDKGFYCWLRKNIISTPETSLSNVNTINNTIDVQFSNSNKKWINNCFVPTIDDTINLQVSIDDMGEFAIFCKEYKLGETVYGDVMYKDDKTITLKPGKTGFKYDEIFKEMVFNENDWNDYTSLYISNNSNNFDTNFTYYGFRADGQKVTGDTKQSVIDQLTVTFPVNEKHGVMIGGDIIQIYEEEWVDYSNSKRYYVMREKDTQTPYIFFNGKKIYASFSKSNIAETWYKFSFSDKSFPIQRTNSNLEKYVSYAGGDYKLLNSKITIDGIEYIEVDGYFTSDIGTLYYKGENVYRWYAIEMVQVSGYSPVRDGSGKIIAFKKQESEPIVYTTGYITGITTSKLEILASKNALVDNAGYTLPGVYNANVSGRTYAQPREGEELDILYKVGNVANIMPYKKTKTFEEIIKAGEVYVNKNYFIGDIIVDMHFYYLGIDNEKYGWTTSFDTIKTNKPTSALLINDNIFCDIVYCIGATLVRRKDEHFELYTEGSSGVTYMETVEFEKKNIEYHLKPENRKSTPMQKNIPGYHSVSYPVVCYVIKKKEVEIDGEIRYTDNTAQFMTDSFKCQNGQVKTYETDYVNTNLVVFPIFRQEYMLGSATMQNIDVNIYIDRGINAALDKHIKLGEVTSMKALEQYSNGFFKIMEN